MKWIQNGDIYMILISMLFRYKSIELNYSITNKSRPLYQSIKSNGSVTLTSKNHEFRTKFRTTIAIAEIDQQFQENWDQTKEFYSSVNSSIVRFPSQKQSNEGKNWPSHLADKHDIWVEKGIWYIDERLEFEWNHWYYLDGQLIAQSHCLNTLIDSWTQIVNSVTV